MKILDKWLQEPCAEICPMLDEGGNEIRPVMCKGFRFSYDYMGIEDCKCDGGCEPLKSQYEVEQLKRETDGGDD